jgi:hypothetical protein
MPVIWEPYTVQKALWPESGRHILAQYDETSVVVYQAYRPSTGEWAAQHGSFGGQGFSFSRMSWIKPNFLWMMFRSGWGTKEAQEVTLAVRLRRDGFDEILRRAVHSQPDPDVYRDEGEWRVAGRSADVRLQWDPDHAPGGAPLERRAIQLGLRGDALRRYATEWVLHIEDVSPHVAEGRALVHAKQLDRLLTPRERVYIPADPDVRRRIGLDEGDR